MNISKDKLNASFLLSKVEATDKGMPRRSSSARVLLRVATVSDSGHGTVSVKPLIPVHLTESDLPGHLVAVLSAHQEQGHDFWCYITGKFKIYFSLPTQTALSQTSFHNI